MAEDCLTTAANVGYAVPCPTKLPPEATPCGLLESVPSCPGAFMTSGGGEFNEWAVLSVVFPTKDPSLRTSTGEGHLVIESSPMSLGAERFIYHGPPGRLIPAGTSRVGTVDAEWFRVSPSNIGSIFLDHLVLVWTIGNHTYGVGFHGWSEASKALGYEVAQNITFVTG